MNTIGDVLSQAIDAKNNDVNFYVWKGPKKEINGVRIQEEKKLMDMSEEELQKCFDHCVSMLYSKNADNPGRYTLLNIINEQRTKCNAVLFMRYLDNTYLPTERKVFPKFEYLQGIRNFINNNLDALATQYGIEATEKKTVKDQVYELPITVVTNGVPAEFESLPIKIVIDACLDVLGLFDKRHITLNFITKLSMWFTAQEMKDLTEYDSEGKIRNRLNVIKERLNIKNNIRLLIDHNNPQLNYTEFRAAIQLKTKNYSKLTTDQLLLLRGKLLFLLEEEVDKHIKDWEVHIQQIDEVCKLKGYNLVLNA